MPGLARDNSENLKEDECSTTSDIFMEEADSSRQNDPLVEDHSKLEDCVLGKLADPSLPDDTVIVTAPARASMVEGQKYPVTIGELKRRMASPERYSVPDLLGMLKLTDSSENIARLQRKLEEQGILKENNHPSVDFVPSEEAKEMADDFVKITNEMFPVELFAERMAMAPQLTADTAEMAMLPLDLMIEMFESDGHFSGVEFAGMEKDLRKVRRGMLRLSNASHGFAKPACVVFFKKLKAVAAEVKRILEEREKQGRRRSSDQQQSAEAEAKSNTTSEEAARNVSPSEKMETSSPQQPDSGSTSDDKKASETRQDIPLDAC
uniref:TF_AP-2 domain-containing protein n=1 Tax=Syphacia muris TaxID=451379 RepID=A0A0N5AP38_9BILA